MPLSLPHTPCPTTTHPSSSTVTKEAGLLLHRAEPSTSKALTPWVPSTHHPTALPHLQSLPSDSTFLSASSRAPSSYCPTSSFSSQPSFSRPIRPSTRYAHHTWERPWETRRLNCRSLCPGPSPPLAASNTAHHLPAAGRGPNRTQMVHTSSGAFPKLSHSSINSTFILRGRCSRLEPTAARRATRNRVSCERVTGQERGSVVGSRSQKIHAPTHSALHFDLQPALPLGLNPARVQKARNPLLQGSGHREKKRGGGSGPRKTQTPPPPFTVSLVGLP